MTTTKTVLGGDDVRAVVADCGSWAVRFGSAGDDSPRAIIPSAVGISIHVPNSAAASGPTAPQVTAAADVHMSDVVDGTAHTATATAAKTACTVSPSDYSAGDILHTAPHLFRDIHPVHTLDLATGDASVRSWDAMTAVWHAGFEALSLDPAAGPFMIIEPTRMWGNRDRAAALQAAFESLQVPAAYISRGSAMATFAVSRTTACVLDVGAQGATAVPVVDGYALTKPIKRAVVGGSFLTEKLRTWAETCLETRPDYDSRERGPGKRMRGDLGRKDQFLRTHHEIKRERILGDDEVRQYKVTDISTEFDVSEEHRQFYRLRVIDDVKANLLQVDASKMSDPFAKDGPKTPNGAQKGKSKSAGVSGDAATRVDDKDEKEPKEKLKEKSSTAERPSEYTLPDGNILSLDENDGHEIGEHLFTSRPDAPITSLSDLVFNCITACDVDLRRDLFSGVIVTGGTMMVPGVVERITRELAILIPQAYKLKIFSSANSIERTSGPWIGGSIVASLGTFQQAWVSKAEYDELGAVGALRKCP